MLLIIDNQQDFSIKIDENSIKECIDFLRLFINSEIEKYDIWPEHSINEGYKNVYTYPNNKRLYRSS